MREENDIVDDVLDEKLSEKERAEYNRQQKLRDKAQDDIKESRKKYWNRSSLIENEDTEDELEYWKEQYGVR